MQTQYFTLEMITELNVLVFRLKVRPVRADQDLIVACMRREFGFASANYHYEDNEVRIPDPGYLTAAKLNQMADRITQILNKRHAR